MVKRVGKSAGAHGAPPGVKLDRFFVRSHVSSETRPAVSRTALPDSEQACVFDKKEAKLLLTGSKIADIGTVERSFSPGLPIHLLVRDTGLKLHGKPCHVAVGICEWSGCIRIPVEDLCLYERSAGISAQELCNVCNAYPTHKHFYLRSFAHVRPLRRHFLVPLENQSRSGHASNYQKHN